MFICCQLILLWVLVISKKGEGQGNMFHACFHKELHRKEMSQMRWQLLQSWGAARAPRVLARATVRLEMARATREAAQLLALLPRPSSQEASHFHFTFCPTLNNKMRFFFTPCSPTCTETSLRQGVVLTRKRTLVTVLSKKLWPGLGGSSEDGGSQGRVSILI